MCYAHRVITIGFVIDDETAAYLNYEKFKREQKVIPAIEESMKTGEFGDFAGTLRLPPDYYDPISALGGALEIVNNFSGEYWTVDDVVTEQGDLVIRESINSDQLVYLPAEKEPKLFNWSQEPTYATPEELISEFRQRFASMGYEFPADFDFNMRICLIVGSYA